MGAGLIQDNYIHDLGLTGDDHLNGTTSNGSTTPLAIIHNTVFNPHGQTDAISLFEDFGTEGNVTITGNLVAGRRLQHLRRPERRRLDRLQHPHHR